MIDELKAKLAKQAEILDVLKKNAKIIIPLVGPHDPKYYEHVRIIIYPDDEKMPLIRKWLEENDGI